MDYLSLSRDIAQQKFQPIYFLTGEEPYYIDQLAALIEAKALREEERSFNQSILYGSDPQVNIPAIVGEVKRYPMMAQRVLVLVKEAQHLRDIESLAAYAEKPQTSTVLVLLYKYKKLDKRKKLAKILQQKHVLFESPKIWDNQLPGHIEQIAKSMGYRLQAKALLMLAESLGTDLGRVHKELEKLQILLPPPAELSAEMVEENVGISKDFNNFELCNAINNGDFVRAMQIQAYFAASPKDHPLVMTLGILYRNFKIVMILVQNKGQSEAALAKMAGISPWQMRNYHAALRFFDLRKVARIFGYLRQCDLQSKGVASGTVSDNELLKELLFKIFYQ